MEFGVLGPVEVRQGDKAIPIGSARECFVLALLLFDADRTVATERLIDALWDDPPATARAQVHNVMRNLRKRLRSLGCDELVATRPLGYELRLGKHTFDLTQFRMLVDRGQEATAAGRHDDARTALGEALALWRGPALASVPADLAGGIQQALHEERLAATEAKIEAELALGDVDALPPLDELIRDHPYRERLYELRIRALARVGRRADALATYRQAYERLADDLGVEPGPALRDLEARILHGEDVTTAPVNRVIPRQLPMALETLTGRDKLLDEIGAELDRVGSSSPAVGVLVGPGGIGKTTLAVAAAHRTSATFTGGQLYADLRGAHADPADPIEVLGAFLRGLGVDGADLPADLDERAALYRSALADTRTLVLLDDAADERQVRSLLPGTAGCGVLVTSRRQLGALVGSHRWTVPGLRPDESVELIGRIVGAERLDTEREAAEAVAATCGHLPLAVSIAAARLASAYPEGSLAEFAGRLADERRRLNELKLGDLDVRASIGLTYRSLDPDQQRLFRRLGLLTMSDWPEWVAYEVVEDGDVDAQLETLTDVHLVQPLGRDDHGQARYQLHDLVAEYARERAYDEDSAADRAAAVRLVVDGWLALATEADEHVAHGQWTAEGLTSPPLPARANTPTAASAGTWFEIEKENLVRAVTQAGDAGATESAARLALRTTGFLTVRSYDEQRLQMLRAALRHDATEPDAMRLRVRLLGALLSVCIRLARHTELQAVVEQQLRLARHLGDARAEYFALREAGRAALRLNRLGEAAEYYEAAIAVELPAEDERLLAWAVGALGIVCIERGDPERGEPMLARHVAAERATGRSMVYSVMLMAHAETLAILERLDEAQAALDEMLTVCQELGDDLGVACSELRSADVDVRAGRLVEASAKLDRSLPLLDARADTGRDVHGLRVAADLAAAEHRWADTADLAEQAAESRRTLGQPLDAARDLARAEIAHRALGDDSRTAACRRDWQAILDELDLDGRSLLLPSFLSRTP